MHHKTKLGLGALLMGCAMVPAWAQESSNVTIYGIIDTFYAYGKAGDNRFSGTVAGGGLYGNRLGFKGSEDLGGGLSAVYDLEYGFTGTTDSALATTRQSWVGLKSSTYGMVSAGRQYAPGYFIPAEFMVMEGSGAFEVRSNLAFAGGYSIAPGGNARANNSVAWSSPKWGGLTVNALYGFGNTETSSDTAGAEDDDRFGLGVAYGTGPLKLGAVYHHTKVAGKDATNEYLIGGAYDFGLLKLVGTLAKKDADGDTSADNTMGSAGVIVPLTSVDSVHFSYAFLNPKGGENNGKGMLLGYTHTLSKRTTLYAGLNSLRYQKDADYTSNSGAYVTVAEAGKTANTVFMGIDHRF